MTGSLGRPLVVAATLVILVSAGFAGAQSQPARPRPSVARPAVSAIVLPPRARTIRIDHSTEAHRALRCERCHEGASASDRAEDDLAPRETACLPCHADRIDRSAAGTRRCAFCHVGSIVAAPARSQPSRLHFSHGTHARRGVRCVRCHAGIDQADSARGEHLPDMRACLECHDATAQGACATCHATLGDGRVRTRYPEGVLTPPGWLFGMGHDRDWIVRHRWVGADHGALCGSCHTDDECADCHDGRVRPERVHPNDYLAIHPQTARRDSPRCASCHSTQSFCTECHARLGISPLAAPVVRARERFHPPAAVWSAGPVLHGREARRSMSACVSCHAERDCVGCHGVLGIGAGVSPHGPGFASRCGPLLRANDRACRACHGELSDIAARCE